MTEPIPPTRVTIALADAGAVVVDLADEPTIRVEVVAPPEVVVP